MKKTVFALVLFGTAVALGIHHYARIKPPPPSPAPQSVQLHQAVAQQIDKDFDKNIESLVLSKAQRTQLDGWLKTDMRLLKTPAERSAHRAKLVEIVGAEQAKEIREAMGKKASNKGELRKAKDEKFKEMVGERDYAKHKENMKKVRERRQILKEQQEAAQAKTEAGGKGSKPSASPTPSGPRTASANNP